MAQCLGKTSCATGVKGKKNETGILFSADEPGRKAGYRAMYDGFTALSPEFPVLRLAGAKKLSEIFSGSGWTIPQFSM